MKALAELLIKNRKAQLLTLLLTGLLLANGGFYLFRTKPASLKASGLETRLQDNRRSMKAKQDQYRLYASFGRGKEQLETFKKMLPAKSDYTGILRKVFKMAKEDGVKSDSISAMKKEVAQNQEEDIVQISFSMPVTGRYKDVRKFIHDMESSSLFLNIDDLGLDSNEKTGDSGYPRYFHLREILMKDKRTTVLIAVLAVLAGILIITKLMFSGPVKNAPAPVRAADKKAALAGMPKTAIKVDIDLLGKPKEGYLASKNIFNPVYEKPSLPKPAAKRGAGGEHGYGNSA